MLYKYILKSKFTWFYRNFRNFAYVFRNELEELEQKVVEERQRYHELTLQEGVGAASMVPRFTVQDQCKLDKDLACYALVIELIVPIDYILLQVSLFQIEACNFVVLLFSCLLSFLNQHDNTYFNSNIQNANFFSPFSQLYLAKAYFPKK